MSEKKLVLSQAEITKKVQELGRTITEDYAGADLVLVGILSGAFIFMADLVRQIDLDLETDFVRVTSYRTGTSPGEILFTKDIELDITGRDVLVIEDIIDTGLTLTYIRDYLAAFKPRSLKICALIDKKERRQVEVAADYLGFEIEKGFLVGYGLDYAEKYRNLPDIYHLENP